jgi:subtilisin family serine protease
MAQGVQSVISNAQGGIIGGNGTSFSGPITAGLVTCLWQAFPDKTNAEILALVKGSADRFNNPDFEYGYGIPDFAFALNELAVEEVKKQSFVLYPNPAKDNITIAFPTEIAEAKLIVFNTLGQIVLEKEVKNNAAVSVEDFAAGIYNYRLTAQNNSLTGKLIKE